MYSAACVESSHLPAVTAAVVLPGMLLPPPMVLVCRSTSAEVAVVELAGVGALGQSAEEPGHGLCVARLG